MVEAARPSARRRWGSLVGVSSLYLGFSGWAYYAWYYNQPALPAFKWGGDGYFGASTYAGGSDKLGHAWANLVLARATTGILRWGGWRPLPASLIGSSMSLVLFTLVEVKDGFYYQFSPGDQIANTLGAVLSAVMVNVPRVDELIDFRVEYFPSKEYRDLWAGRSAPADPDEPQQTWANIAEDYSGQRYLLALHVGALPGLRGRTDWSRFTRFVDVAVGYETDKYKPDPIDAGAVPSQHLFLGLTLNAQGLVDGLLEGRRSRPARVTRSIGHHLFEYMSPPFTSVSVAGTSRSPSTATAR